MQVAFFLAFLGLGLAERHVSLHRLDQAAGFVGALKPPAEGESEAKGRKSAFLQVTALALCGGAWCGIAMNASKDKDSPTTGDFAGTSVTCTTPQAFEGDKTLPTCGMFPIECFVRMAWSSTTADIGSWLPGDALQRQHGDAAEAETRWHGCREIRADLPQHLRHLAHSRWNPDKQEPGVASVSKAPEKEVYHFLPGRALPPAVPVAKDYPDDGTGYMVPQLPGSRIFNVASRGRPSGAQRHWCFERLPSLMPTPLARDQQVGRSCAGLPVRLTSESRRALDRPVQPTFRQQSEPCLR
ncbi:unnamed protein product [Effrenium voratum]|nr:unnamed protein product [Effrenium voratum]